MIKPFVHWIHRLRIAFFVIIVLFFFQVAGLSPAKMSVFLGAKVGSAIGMSTSVPENPFNSLASALNEKEDRLDARERSIAAREQALNQGPIGDRTLLWLLIAGIGLLFALIIMNFYLDLRRRRTSGA